MKKSLVVFLVIATVVGGLKLIVSDQNKKVSTFTQCCDGGCTCGNNNEDHETKDERFRGM